VGPGTVSSITPAHFSPPFCLAGISFTRPTSLSLSLSLSLFSYLWPADIINTLISFSQLSLNEKKKNKQTPNHFHEPFSLSLSFSLYLFLSKLINLGLSNYGYELLQEERSRFS
jgi:hypothetical protein